MNKHLLCITPDLKRSGAPIALLGLLRILITKDRYDIDILTYGEGELLPAFTELLGEYHIEILHGLNPTLDFRYRLQNSYDVILLNTAAAHTFSLYFQNLSIPVYWWIHEAPENIKISFPEFPNPHLLSPNFRLFVPSTGAAKWFFDHYSYKISVLPVPVNMPACIEKKTPINIPDDKIVFFIPGAYTYIKGQDILLSAISSLPVEFSKKSLFIFCGYTLDKQAEYKELIFNMAAKLDNVIMLDNLPQESVHALIDKCDCVIAPSRIDCLPTTIAEGLMYKKLCLVSCHTGISDYIQDCKTGFVFSDDPDTLFKRLLLIINDLSPLRTIADSGYNIYSEIFSPAAVSLVCDNIGL